MIVVFWQSLIQSSKQEDNLSWHHAMNGLFANEYWKAAEKEIYSLEGMDNLDVVECKADMNDGHHESCVRNFSTRLMMDVMSQE